MKAISYALFGANKERQDNCFDFNSYLSSMMVCIRMNRLVYPDWDNVIHVDKTTHEAYYTFFEALSNTPNIVIKVQNEAPICEAMLWRMKPIFELNNDVTSKYTHVICRDLDSPSTYKEAQAVQHWINRMTKAAHAITDSDSHTIPLMGGMIGFMPDHFLTRTGFKSWDQMMGVARNHYSFNYKGSDQDFLNRIIYPYFSQHGSDSITQHYFEGMPNTFLSDYYTCQCGRGRLHKQDCPLNIPLDINPELNETIDISGHIGCAGYYIPPTVKIFNKYAHLFADLKKIELLYPNIFFWNN